jgi:tetratricopeptide (TPR) repeat protein
MRIPPHHGRHGLRLASLLILLACSVAVTAGEQSSLETRLLADAADGRLDRHTLLHAALIAGGVGDETELRQAERRLESLWLEVEQPLIARLPQHDRPKAIFLALHRLLLSGKYQAECTELHRTIQTGDYNCVTATILYLELCRRHGLQAVAVAVPGHVYCRLLGPPPEDVQTTCRDWFDVRDGVASSSLVGAVDRQLALQSGKPRELSDCELLGKIYYNRGVSLLEKHDYAGAIELLRQGLALDPLDEPARNNLLAAHNNWALALCDAGDFAAAAARLAEGQSIDREYVPLQTNDLYVHQKWVLQLCDQGRYSSAIDVLDRCHLRRPEAPLFDSGRYAVYGMWSRSLLEGNRLKDALAVLDAARRRFGDEQELRRQEQLAFEAGVRTLLQEGNRSEARSMLEVALARHPKAESLASLFRELE